jgi:hypothetical protein
MVKNKLLYALFRIFNRFRLKKVVEIEKPTPTPTLRLGVGACEPLLPTYRTMVIGLNLKYMNH